MYKPYLNKINHMTPYTDWVMYVAEHRSADIDLSQVTEVKMMLIGSANIVGSEQLPVNMVNANAAKTPRKMAP